MRVYSTSDEERIRDGKLVREWAASGLLDSAQSASLQAELQTDLRQTNVFLRAVLWVFATLLVIAGVALLANFFRLTEPAPWKTLLILSGLACWALAELACRKRLYRFGIEEALAVSSIVLLSLGISELFSGHYKWEEIAGLAVVSIGGLSLYFRFGFVYGAVGSLAFSAAIPFRFDWGTDEKRFLSAMIFAVTLALARRRRRHQPEPAGSGLATIEAAAWLGTYLMLNLKLSSTFFAIPTWLFYSTYQSPAAETATGFYIFSWAMIWLLPAAGLWLGLQNKDRLLIDVSIVMTLLTLTTNKRYLGWAVHAWDPMVLGVVLMTAAIVMRRWLQQGPNAERYGFTAIRLFRSDERKLAAISIASSMMQPRPSASGQSETQPEFRGGGGQSGGGGATGTF